MTEMKEIDALDGKILRILMKDSRKKITHIADACKISSTAVIKRIKRLKQRHVIINSALNMNMAYFGYSYPVLMGVNLDYGCEQKIIELIKDHTKVAGIDKTIGNYDLCIFVYSENVNELDKLKHMIKKQTCVRNIEINIWGKFLLNYDNIDI